MPAKLLSALLACFIAAPALAQPAKQSGPEFVPTSEFQVKQVQGWEIYVHQTLLDDESELGAAVLQEIEMQLYRISRLLPAGPLRKLREIPIWIHMVKITSDVRSPLAEYHWSADWLRDNGRNPDMARAIEIGDMKSFLHHTSHKPFLLLHELSHGYHERILTAEQD